MAAVTAKAKRSPAQVRAGQAYAAAGRKKQAATRAAYKKTHQGKAPPRTAKQAAAGNAFAAAGRAAQAARRQGKQPAAPRARKLALTVQAPVSPPPPGAVKRNIHELPVCAAVAVAEHLAACTGLTWAGEDILELARLGGEIIPHLLETAAPGFRGAPPCRFWPSQPDPYTITGLTLPQGPHAVLQAPGYVISWGAASRCDVPAEEAWAVEWLTG